MEKHDKKRCSAIAVLSVVTLVGIGLGLFLFMHYQQRNRQPHLQNQPDTTSTEFINPSTKPDLHPTETLHIHCYTAEKKPATCSEDGYTLYTCACGDTYRSDETKAKEHQYGTGKQTEATCTTKGGLVKVCKICGHKDIENEVTAFGHDWSSWETTKEATTADSGEKTRACNRCHKTEKKTIAKIKAPEPTTNPTETEPPATKPRLDSVGRIIGSACDICGKPVGDWCRAGVCMQWPFSRYCTCCGAYVFDRKCHHCTVLKYIVKYCDRCGKQYGDGTNGTCIGWLIDMICPKCGKDVPAHTCHTCSG